MCDDLTEGDYARALSSGTLTRRGFAAAGGALGLTLAMPAFAHPAQAGRDVTITTPDGSAEGYFVPAAGGAKAPGVLIWPDIMGLRPAFRAMADRLAQGGRAVLVVNQFYRTTPLPILTAGEDFGQPPVRERLMALMQGLTAEGTVRDATAFAAFLAAQPEVDMARGMAVTGYCMGGPMAFRTAAALPDRVRAVATFHGGGLVTDAADSPHRLIPSARASYLVAIAANDDARAPGDKDALKTAFAAAGRPAEVEVYAGTQHGWCPIDSRVYDQPQAERAWARLGALLDGALGA